MKSIFIAAIIFINLLNSNYYANADTFLETIAKVQAKDALTIGPDNKFYGSNYDTGVIYEIDSQGKISIVLEANNGGPAGIRFDKNGTMYVGMYNLSSIVTVSNGKTETFSSGVREPIALDWDSSGDLYVSNFAGDATVTKVAPDGSSENFAKIDQLSGISSLCVDNENNIYVTSYGSGDIYKVAQNGNSSLFSSTGAEGISFIQFDKSNNKFYTTVNGKNQIMEIDINGNHQIVVDTPAGGFQDGPLSIATIDAAIGLAVAEDGNSIFFATGNHIRKLLFADPLVDQIAPYFTSTPIISGSQDTQYSYQFTFEDPNNDSLSLNLTDLPAWLSFDGADIVSGIPTASDSGTVHTVTASLSDGVSTVIQSYELSVSQKATPPPEETPSVSSSGGGSFAVTILFLLIYVVRKQFIKLNT